MSEKPTLSILADEYAEWMAQRNYAAVTIRQKRHHLVLFFAWCEERSLSRPSEITRAILERYQRHLFTRQTPHGNKLSFKTQSAHMITLQVFFKWLCQREHISSDPASGLELPRTGRRLPRGVLSQSEVEGVLNQPDTNKSVGIRDRAMMEVFYSCGIRRSELVNLAVFDIDMSNATLFIREGKGQKDRIVPIGDRALLWLQKYLDEVRPAFLANDMETALFIGQRGEPLSPGSIGIMVKDYMRAEGIEKPGACHLFRHSMATSMLENGADLRVIQAILGHSSLSTTQIYTHLTVQRLKEIHRATHPAKMEREQQRSGQGLQRMRIRRSEGFSIRRLVPLLLRKRKAFGSLLQSR